MQSKHLNCCLTSPCSFQGYILIDLISYSVQELKDSAQVPQCQGYPGQSSHTRVSKAASQGPKHWALPGVSYTLWIGIDLLSSEMPCGILWSHVYWYQGTPNHPCEPQLPPKITLGVILADILIQFLLLSMH